MSEKSFPTEIVELPSKGHFYPSDNPLSSGKVEIKYMTAKEEDILMSPNLLKKGVAIDMLLKSLIVTKINYDDLLIGDKNAIMIAARVLAYGKDYQFELTDPSTGEVAKDNVDLTSFPDKEIKFDKSSKGINEFSFELPASKRNITFKLLTHGLDQSVNRELQSLKKISKRAGYNPEITTRLKHIITSVDGDDKREVIRKFIDEELLSRDSLALRNYIREITPDLDMSFIYTSEDGSDKEITVPMTVSFFWPDTGS
tara:strand:+ start:1901 stop:2668 length:768 start_codon:yes stop_codon:yes gene_type:complete